MPRCAVLLLCGLLLGACGAGEADVTSAEETYGAPVDATEALPAPSVSAEWREYQGRPVVVDGRIAAVGAAGCTVIVEADDPPLVVEAPRTDASGCAWTVPGEAQGFAVAAGTLRAVGDTLRLTANGVRVTPVRMPNPDS